MEIREIVPTIVQCALLVSTIHYYVCCARDPEHLIKLLDHYSKAKWIYLLAVFIGSLAILMHGFMYLLSWLPGTLGTDRMPANAFLAGLLAFIGTFHIMGVAESRAREALALHALRSKQ